MTKRPKMLSATFVRTVNVPGRYGDGRGGLVFPSPTGRAHSQSSLAKLLRELRIDAVPHGFRSSFRDWAAECAEAPRVVCELALAHVNSDRVEAAHRRSDLFERRRPAELPILMRSVMECVERNPSPPRPARNANGHGPASAPVARECVVSESGEVRVAN